jgi:hypothetical protein
MIWMTQAKKFNEGTGFVKHLRFTTKYLSKTLARFRRSFTKACKKNTFFLLPLFSL